MNFSILLAGALQHGARNTGYNMIKAREFIKLYTCDKRYQLYAVCGTSSWSYNEHGKIEYAGRQYEYEQHENYYTVKPATW